MRATGIPNGVSGIAYGQQDVDALADGAYSQQRLIKNAPCPIGKAELARLFSGAMSYW
jgi:alcohol dehydrogenase class IV